MKIEKYDAIAMALKSIAHPDRLRILNLLGCEGELSVSCIKKATGLSQPMTSQHLLLMRERGILSSTRRENKVYYSIANRDVLKVIDCMKRCGREGGR